MWYLENYRNPRDLMKCEFGKISSDPKRKANVEHAKKAIRIADFWGIPRKDKMSTQALLPSQTLCVVPGCNNQRSVRFTNGDSVINVCTECVQRIKHDALFMDRNGIRADFTRQESWGYLVKMVTTPKPSPLHDRLQSIELFEVKD